MWYDVIMKAKRDLKFQPRFRRNDGVFHRKFGKGYIWATGSIYDGKNHTYNHLVKWEDGLIASVGEDELYSDPSCRKNPKIS